MLNSILVQRLRKSPALFEPDEYQLRVQSARIIQSDENVFVALDLVELESGGRVDGLPLWVDGPNAERRRPRGPESAHHRAIAHAWRPADGRQCWRRSSRSWRGWSSMHDWHSLSTVARAVLTTSSLKSSLLRMRHDPRGAAVHVRRRCSASR